ncbi:hypothetical protein FRC10_008357 [Ceratobasidium sp. 414]|nr:hypothetical protein FRC10_008357 [Ceratobasidium sp. 414]
MTDAWADSADTTPADLAEPKGDEGRDPNTSSRAERDSYKDDSTIPPDRDVRRSRSRSPAREGSRGDANPGTNLHISGLHPRVTDRMLEDMFSKYGKIEKAQVVYDPHTRDSRGFGFVMMSTLEEAEAAISGLNGYVLEGMALRVDKVSLARPARDTNSSNENRHAEAEQERRHLGSTEDPLAIMSARIPHGNMTRVITGVTTMGRTVGTLTEATTKTTTETTTAMETAMGTATARAPGTMMTATGADTKTGEVGTAGIATGAGTGDVIQGDRREHPQDTMYRVDTSPEDEGVGFPIGLPRAWFPILACFVPFCRYRRHLSIDLSARGLARRPTRPECAAGAGEALDQVCDFRGFLLDIGGNWQARHRRSRAAPIIIAHPLLGKLDFCTSEKHGT